MLGNRELTLDDYLAILRRHLWVILIPVVLGPVLAYSGSLWLPERYTSQSLVLVEQQKIPESFVKSVVTDELNERLAAMREQILSRSRLQPIVEKFGLYKDQKQAAMEGLVDGVRRAVVVTPLRAMGSNPNQSRRLAGFYITFTADNPRLAQQICAEITSMFMEENLRSREQRARGTTEFLAKQVEEAKRKLDDEDAKFADFKKRYLGQLPGQEQANLSVLTSLNTQLDAVTQVLNRTQQDKAYMESVLAQQLTAWQAAQSANSPVTMEQQLSTLQSQMVSLEARYKPDHPDVIRTKNDIELLKRKLQEAASLSKDKPAEDTGKMQLPEPPQIQQLRTQIHIAEATIREQTRRQQQLQEQIKIYQARVQLSPVVEQQYKELTRDYQIASSVYNDLLGKRTQSEIATDLERRQQGEQFRVMDPASLPGQPSFPNRPVFAAGGFGGGLFLGLGIALLLELRDKTLRNERDVAFFLQLPTLALLPTVDSANGRSKRFWKRTKKPRTTELELRVDR